MDDTMKQLTDMLREHPAQIEAAAHSRDGQELLALLAGGSSGAALQQAAASAAQGNPAEMVRMLARIMQSPEGAELIGRISRAIQE